MKTKYYFTKNLKDGTQLVLRVRNRTHATVLKRIFQFFDRTGVYGFEGLLPTTRKREYIILREETI